MDDHPAPQHYYTRLEWPVQVAPQRVVSLVPSLTEALFDLDLAQRLIAITDDCTRPADRVAALRRIGGVTRPDISQIVALQPDLVLANDDENRAEDLSVLREAGVTVWPTHTRTVFEALNLLWNLMDVFDHARMIPRVREIERAYDYSLGASLSTPPLRVFAALARDPWITFNGDTYAHDVLKVCGGENVFAQRAHTDLDALPADERLRDGRFLRVSLDDIIAAQPQVVLLANESYTTFAESDIAFLQALDIPAAQQPRIHLIDGSLLTWHGTRVAYALRDLPPLLSGETNDHDDPVD
jgi:ABC-type Fe3+-hydroxamate transport system substrate-binding protein